MDTAITQLTAIVTGIIGIATLSVILSKNANTAGVLTAGAGGLAQDIGAATAPITGSTSNSGFNLTGLGGIGAPVGSANN
jgi:hypothetical protein